MTKKMKICIFGGGPTGLRLADRLSAKGHSIELHDKECKLGGCWKVDWEDGYYTEHSPRVVSSNYTRFLSHLKKMKFNTNLVYSGRVGTTFMFIKYFYRYMTYYDVYEVLSALYFFKNTDRRSLKQWMNDKQISEDGKKALSKLALSISAPDRDISAYAFFSAVYSGRNATLLQIAESDLWLASWESELTKRENITVFKNSKLEKFFVEKGEITGAKTNMKICNADMYICAMPLKALQDVMYLSPEEIKNNWMSYNVFEKYCNRSSYTAFGFQLHFNEHMFPPSTWSSSGFTDWSIEILSISKYTESFTHRNDVKEVWSCAIVDMDAKSKVLKKSVNEISEANEVVNEGIRQIGLNFHTSIYPAKVTLASGLRYNFKEKFWDVEHHAYNPSPEGEMNPKGKLEELYSVGPHNLYEVATLESAFESADKFVNEYFGNSIFRK